MNQFREPEGNIASINLPDPSIKNIPTEGEISLLDLLIVVLKRRGLIVKTTFGLALLGLILAFVLPNRFTAVTSILPPRENTSIGSSLMSQIGALGSVASMAGGGSFGLKNPNDLQVSLLKSRTVEDAMVDRFHLMERFHAKRRSIARSALENIVNIEANAKDGLIYISVTDRDPKLAAEMANGYVEEFKRYSAGMAVTEASQRRLFFEEQLAQSKDNLANAEEELKKIELKTGLIQLDSQARVQISLVADLRAQIAAKQTEIAAMRTFATGENPSLQIAQQQLAGLQAQAQKMGAISESATNALIPKGNIQEAGLEYIRKYRDVKYYETIFDLLARQYEIAKVDEAKQGSIVQIIDRAVPPDHRSFPKGMIFVLVGTLLGFIFGTFWAFSLEGYDRISKNPAERTRLETIKQLLPFRRPEIN